MPEEVVNHYIESLNTPAFLFVIGVLVILAFVVVQAIPKIENFKTLKLQIEKEIEMKKIEQEQRREERKAQEFKDELARDRARTEVIGKQNEILEGLTRSADSQTLQMSALMAQLEESKIRSRAMGDTIKDTNCKVSEIHTMIVKANNKV